MQLLTRSIRSFCPTGRNYVRSVARNSLHPHSLFGMYSSISPHRMHYARRSAWYFFRLHVLSVRANRHLVHYARLRLSAGPPSCATRSFNWDLGETLTICVDTYDDRSLSSYLSPVHTVHTCLHLSTCRTDACGKRHLEGIFLRVERSFYM